MILTNVNRCSHGLGTRKRTQLFCKRHLINKPDVFDSWKFQWPGDLYYSHRSNHSKGVPVLNARPCNLSWSGKIVMTDL